MAIRYLGPHGQPRSAEEAELPGLIATGRVTPATTVWVPGTNAWVTALELGWFGPPEVSGTARCAECGAFVPVEEALPLGHGWVCGGCKATAVQRLSAGGVVQNPLRGVWRDGRQVVLHVTGDLGHACIECGAPADAPRVKRKLEWVRGLKRAMILGGGWVHTWTTEIPVPVCQHHQALHRRLNSVTLALVLAALAATAVGFFAKDRVSTVGFMAAGSALVVALGVAMSNRHFILVTKMDKQYIRFRGAKKPYRDLLPPWTGPK